MKVWSNLDEEARRRALARRIERLRQRIERRVERLTIRARGSTGWTSAGAGVLRAPWLLSALAGFLMSRWRKKR